MKVAYADPPYIGQANKYPEKQEVNHQELINRLCSDYDAWALSASSPSLKIILPMCPDDVRVAAWVKPFCSFKVGVNPAYAWEPVIFRGSRRLPRTEPTTRDWLACSMTLEKGLIGAKPPKFCYWLFDLLGMLPEDEFDDLYHGTGIVTKCWQNWRNQKLNINLELELTLIEKLEQE